MGTHPIFESDFDCLTEIWGIQGVLGDDREVLEDRVILVLLGDENRDRHVADQIHAVARLLAGVIAVISETVLDSRMAAEITIEALVDVHRNRNENSHHAHLIVLYLLDQSGLISPWKFWETTFKNTEKLEISIFQSIFILNFLVVLPISNSKI